MGCTWTRQAILKLIELYTEKEVDFKNTSVRNDLVWKDIAEKMSEEGFEFTKTQVENKFKYLKARYV